MESLQERIGAFYDQSSPLWLDMWGEHMHHGFYGPNGTQKKDHRQAQLDLIEALLNWGQIEKAQHILDAGCGVGGSARYLARKYNAQVLGLTLSQVQVDRGNQLSQLADLQQSVQLQKRNVYDLSESDGPIDLIYSMESAEHMEDKAGLLDLFYRLLKPGGKFVMATWCHRDTRSKALSAKEEKQLAKLYRLYHLPPMISIAQYEHLAKEQGFTEVETADWSAAVAPFWGAVIRSALSFQGFSGLLKAGPATLKGAWAMRYMQAGYRSGLIRFGLLRGQKA